jgi:hypothetical protein
MTSLTENAGGMLTREPSFELFFRGLVGALASPFDPCLPFSVFFFSLSLSEISFGPSPRMSVRLSSFSHSLSCRASYQHA